MDKAAETQPRQVHFNGFKISASGTDITMDLSLDGKDIIVLRASQKVAQTFGEIIEKTVNQEFPPGSLLHLYTPERDAEELILAKGSSLRVENE